MRLTFDTFGNEKQKDCARYWSDKTTTDIVYGGSKGSGKSFLGVSLIFHDALVYPNTHYFIARKSLNDLRKFTVPSVHEVFGLWGLGDQYFNFNASDSIFNLYNGSKVFLLAAPYLPSDPNFQRFGSMQMTRGWIEEAGEFEEEAKNNLAASIGRWKNDDYGICGKLLQTCNPAKNYLYRGYYQKNKQGILEPWKKFIQALPTDNKKLASGYLEHLNRTLSENSKKRLLHGDWEYDDNPNALCSYDKIVDVFTNAFVKDGEGKITADIARYGKDTTRIVYWKGWRMIEMVTLVKASIPEVSQAIKAMQSRYAVSNSNTIADEDGIGGGVVDLIKCKGFINNSKAITLYDKPEQYDNLKSQCAFYLADKINRSEMYSKLEGSEKEMLMEELEQLQAREVDSDMKNRIISKDMMKEKLGRSPDIFDNCIMRAWFDLNDRTQRTRFMTTQ